MKTYKCIITYGPFTSNSSYLNTEIDARSHEHAKKICAIKYDVEPHHVTTEVK